MITATDGPATITDYNGTDDSIEVLYRNTDGAPTVSVTANTAGDALVSRMVLAPLLSQALLQL